jgi:hypothetical protein
MFKIIFFWCAHAARAVATLCVGGMVMARAMVGRAVAWRLEETQQIEEGKMVDVRIATRCFFLRKLD